MFFLTSLTCYDISIIKNSKRNAKGDPKVEVAQRSPLADKIMKKILFLVGNPDSESLSASLAESYAEGARKMGNLVKVMKIGDMKFDPILHKGYKVIQELEPDLKQFQEEVKWCDHFVLIYPSWWSTMPALLKGLFDRAWLPGFAFKFHDHENLGWSKLLAGRTSTVFVTSHSRPLLARVLFGDSTNEIKKGILEFAGFDVNIKKIGPIQDHISIEEFKKFSRKFYGFGKKTY